MYNRPEMHTQDYKEWAKAVKKRDGYRCVACGSKYAVKAHHCDSWDWAISRRYDVDNGVTLCGGRNSCHNTFHAIYGHGNNTIDQTAAFLGDKGKDIWAIIYKN